MIIHPHIPKRKKRKPTAKQRELQAQWESLVKQYETKPKKTLASKSYKSPKIFIRETPVYPSAKTGVHDTTLKERPQYTGTEMIGIGTLHKSNAVPIFRKEDAKDQANMRR